MRIQWVVVVSLLGATLMSAGCASRPPAAIAAVPESIPELAMVRGQPEAYHGQEVRWGGVIALVENQADHTLVEVVSRPLDRRGRPRESDDSQGRFVVIVNGFLDPVVHAQGREFTVTGHLDGVMHRPIGEYRYAFPVVNARGTYLWAPRPEPVREPCCHYYSPRMFHSPLYDPWYPFHPYYRPWRY
ncbi:hypothetical protein CKO35_05730 [Ectothiorhodospira shaposhnikovii]|uniref:Slp family lipoprotein n=1 Tax=Ectothiorhodospira shaposhnikovii TaxID=1054 RepID=UPI0019063013|nr:Slp family lipoprotein [Ectothiorhodospira shaposhnikovii]MBK1672808.1 hypothetical protein [Ectothiorhodospira shaposhnikovii]